MLWKHLLALVSYLCLLGVSGCWLIPQDEDDDDDDSCTYHESSASSPLAANLEPVAPWTPSLIFTDIFPKSRPFYSRDCEAGGSSVEQIDSVDANGWVSSLDEGECADTLLLSNNGDHYPTGTYVLLWEGEGTLIVMGDIEPVEIHTTSDMEKNAEGLYRATFEVTEDMRTDLGIYFRIAATNSSDYIRNIRLLPPGGICGDSATELDYFAFCESGRGGSGSCSSGRTCYDFEEVYWDRFSGDTSAMNEPKAVFHPEWLREFRSFRALRYMKWARTEDDSRTSWSARVGVHNQFFTEDDYGVPIEYMIAMSNVLDADIWINLPTAANNDYVTQFANFVEDRLEADLNVYLEYSNETFNELQPTPYSHILDQAEGESSIPSSDDDRTKVSKWTAIRAAQMFDLWEEVMDPARVTRVLGAFQAVPGFVQSALEFGDYASFFEAIAVGGYIGPDRRFADDTDAFDAMSVDDVFQEIRDGSVLNSGASLGEIRAGYDTHKTLANEHGLSLIAYEIGQHIVAEGGPEAVGEVMNAANRDNRMGDAIYDNQQNFRDAGGDISFFFLVFDLWNVNGSFGVYEYQGQEVCSSPKMRGLQRFISDNPCWWSGCD